MRQLKTSVLRKLALPVASAGVLLSTGCTAEGVTCATAHGDFAVKLSLTSGSDEACNGLVGGWYGVQTYNQPRSDGRPNAEDSTVAIKSEDMGIMIDDYSARLGDIPDAVNPPFALGPFSSGKPEGDVCTVPTLAPARQDFPALEAIPAVPDDPATEEDESEAEVPAEEPKTVEYAWSNMRFIVSPSIIGTVFTANLTHKVNGCTAEYTAVGLYPAVYCGDDDGNPVDALCAPEANPELGTPYGSGINPDFRDSIKCNPDLLLCMFEDGKLPDALK